MHDSLYFQKKEKERLSDDHFCKEIYFFHLSSSLIIIVVVNELNQTKKFLNHGKLGSSDLKVGTKKKKTEKSETFPLSTKILEKYFGTFEKIQRKIVFILISLDFWNVFLENLVLNKKISIPFLRIFPRDSYDSELISSSFPSKLAKFDIN